eukprot:augustus_masked-scaffold_13-processed-gene-2.13-mRNA-1 protein AED:1.00 eAED:1.00 QI:0/-1/0/0/-1/1/1/0/2126
MFIGRRYKLEELAKVKALAHVLNSSLLRVKISVLHSYIFSELAQINGLETLTSSLEPEGSSLIPVTLVFELSEFLLKVVKQHITQLMSEFTKRTEETISFTLFSSLLVKLLFLFQLLSQYPERSVLTEYNFSTVVQQFVTSCLNMLRSRVKETFSLRQHYEVLDNLRSFVSDLHDFEIQCDEVSGELLSYTHFLGEMVSTTGNLHNISPTFSQGTSQGLVSLATLEETQERTTADQWLNDDANIAKPAVMESGITISPNFILPTLGANEVQSSVFSMDISLNAQFESYDTIAIEIEALFKLVYFSLDLADKESFSSTLEYIKRWFELGVADNRNMFYFIVQLHSLMLTGVGELNDFQPDFMEYLLSFGFSFFRVGFSFIASLYTTVHKTAPVFLPSRSLLLVLKNILIRLYSRITLLSAKENTAEYVEFLNEFKEITVSFVEQIATLECYIEAETDEVNLPAAFVGWYLSVIERTALLSCLSIHVAIDSVQGPSLASIQNFCLNKSNVVLSLQKSFVFRRVLSIFASSTAQYFLFVENIFQNFAQSTDDEMVDLNEASYVCFLFCLSSMLCKNMQDCITFERLMRFSYCLYKSALSSDSSWFSPVLVQSVVFCAKQTVLGSTQVSPYLWLNALGFLLDDLNTSLGVTLNVLKSVFSIDAFSSNQLLKLSAKGVFEKDVLLDPGNMPAFLSQQAPRNSSFSAWMEYCSAAWFLFFFSFRAGITPEARRNIKKIKQKTSMLTEERRLDMFSYWLITFSFSGLLSSSTSENIVSFYQAYSSFDMENSSLLIECNPHKYYGYIGHIFCLEIEQSSQPRKTFLFKTFLELSLQSVGDLRWFSALILNLCKVIHKANTRKGVETVVSMVKILGSHSELSVSNLCFLLMYPLVFLTCTLVVNNTPRNTSINSSIKSTVIAWNQRLEIALGTHLEEYCQQVCISFPLEQSVSNDYSLVKEVPLAIFTSPPFLFFPFDTLLLPMDYVMLGDEMMEDMMLLLVNKMSAAKHFSAECYLKTLYDQNKSLKLKVAAIRKQREIGVYKLTEQVSSNLPTETNTITKEFHQFLSSLAKKETLATERTDSTATKIREEVLLESLEVSVLDGTNCIPTVTEALQNVAIHHVGIQSKEKVLNLVGQFLRRQQIQILEYLCYVNFLSNWCPCSSFDSLWEKVTNTAETLSIQAMVPSFCKLTSKFSGNIGGSNFSCVSPPLSSLSVSEIVAMEYSTFVKTMILDLYSVTEFNLCFLKDILPDIVHMTVPIHILSNVLQQVVLFLAVEGKVERCSILFSSVLEKYMESSMSKKVELVLSLLFFTLVQCKKVWKNLEDHDMKKEFYWLYNSFIFKVEPILVSKAASHLKFDLYAVYMLEFFVFNELPNINSEHADETRGSSVIVSKKRKRRDDSEDGDEPLSSLSNELASNIELLEMKRKYLTSLSQYDSDAAYGIDLDAYAQIIAKQNEAVELEGESLKSWKLLFTFDVHQEAPMETCLGVGKSLEWTSNQGFAKETPFTETVLCERGADLIEYSISSGQPELSCLMLQSLTNLIPSRYGPKLIPSHQNQAYSNLLRHLVATQMFKSLAEDIKTSSKKKTNWSVKDLRNFFAAKLPSALWNLKAATASVELFQELVPRILRSIALTSDSSNVEVQKLIFDKYVVVLRLLLRARLYNLCPAVFSALELTRKRANNFIGSGSYETAVSASIKLYQAQYLRGIGRNELASKLVSDLSDSISILNTQVLNENQELMQARACSTILQVFWNLEDKDAVSNSYKTTLFAESFGYLEQAGSPENIEMAASSNLKLANHFFNTLETFEKKLKDRGDSNQLHIEAIERTIEVVQALSRNTACPKQKKAARERLNYLRKDLANITKEEVLKTQLRSRCVLACIQFFGTYLKNVPVNWPTVPALFRLFSVWFKNYMHEKINTKMVELFIQDDNKTSTIPVRLLLMVVNQMLPYLSPYVRKSLNSDEIFGEKFSVSIQLMLEKLMEQYPFSMTPILLYAENTMPDAEGKASVQEVIVGALSSNHKLGAHIAAHRNFYNAMIRLGMYKHDADDTGVFKVTNVPKVKALLNKISFNLIPVPALDIAITGGDYKEKPVFMNKSFLTQEYVISPSGRSRPKILKIPGNDGKLYKIIVKGGT